MCQFILRTLHVRTYTRSFRRKVEGVAKIYVRYSNYIISKWNPTVVKQRSFQAIELFLANWDLGKCHSIGNNKCIHPINKQKQKTEIFQKWIKRIIRCECPKRRIEKEKINKYYEWKKGKWQKIDKLKNIIEIKIKN